MRGSQSVNQPFTVKSRTQDEVKMKRLWLLCAPAGFLLASATPPSFSQAPQVLQPESVLDAYPLCPEGLDCTELALSDDGEDAPPEVGPPVQVAKAAPPPPPTIPAPQPEPLAAQEESRPLAPVDDGSGLRILVSIPQQKAYVFDDGELVATSPVSTGKRGHETPAGTFRILQKKVHHRSNKYANAPMPYMQRLTSYGIALHAGHLPVYPASHGCIRLPRQFAKKLYAITDHGTTVTITNRKPASPEAAIEMT